jgi:hypothetical protein
MRCPDHEATVRASPSAFPTSGGADGPSAALGPLHDTGHSVSLASPASLPRLLPLGTFLGFRPSRHKTRFIAQANESHSIQLVGPELRPTASRQRVAIRPLAGSPSRVVARQPMILPASTGFRKAIIPESATSNLFRPGVRWRFRRAKPKLLAGCRR